MFDKNHLMGNTHLKAEATGDFVQRIQKEQPELAEAVAKLKELLPEEVYQRAFSNIQTFILKGKLKSTILNKNRKINKLIIIKK